MIRLPQADLDEVVGCLGDHWYALRNAKVLITGGTGFFGIWLVAVLLHAERKLGLGLNVYVMARRPELLLQRAPEFRQITNLHLMNTWPGK